jgi:PAS domain S-box-containing protein
MAGDPLHKPKPLSIGAASEGASSMPDANRLLAAIVESSDDAILSKDFDGIITSWNKGAERLYGYSPAEIVGKPISTLVPPEVEDDAPMLMARLRRGERIEHYETLRMDRDGRRLHVSLTISPLLDDSGRMVGASAIARDITDQKIEQSRWRLLSDVGQAATSSLDPEELLSRMADLLVREVADYAVTYLYEGNEVRRVGAAHADPEEERLVRRLGEMKSPTVHDRHGAGMVIRTGEPFLAETIEPERLLEVADDPEYLRILEALGPISTIVAPLVARGRTVGAVAVATTAHSGRHYTDTDLVLIREVADRVGLALDNARLYAQLRAELGLREAVEESLNRRYGQLRVLYEMTESVTRAGEMAEIYDLALDGLRDGLGIHRASILLFDEDGVMRFKAWRGLSDEYRRAVEGHSPWAPNASDPASITIPDVEADSGLETVLRKTILDEGIRSMAFIPLLFGGKLLGKFMLYGAAPRALAADEIELARTIAGTIAFAITRMADESKIREARDAAERASAAKSQFLSIMSHELRTPLNAVLGYAELLMLGVKGEINDEQREQIRRIQVSAGHQLELVDELLAYSRLEAGREQPRLMEIDARRVINDVAEILRPEIESKRLRLVVERSDSPLTLVTDPAKLRQLVLNLAGNAAKYTEQGSVTLRTGLDGERLVIEVQDTGPGIPEDKLDYIFEPFARVDESLTRPTAGSGLGLAIARRLAELLDGELTVRSEIGVGSTFAVRLPFRHSQADPDSQE